MSYKNTAFQLNGYSFSDAKFTLNGIDLAGIRGIDINTEQEKVNQFGAGVNPVGRGRGVRDTTGSIDLDIETAKIVKNAFGVTSMLDIPPSNLIVTFDDGNGNILVAVISFLEFNNDGIASSQGDTEVVRSYDVVAGDIVIS